MSQDSGDREAAERLTKEFNELNGTLRLLMAERNNQNTSTQSITIDAGGPAVWVAVWIATVCCAVMLTLTFVSRADQIDQKRRIDVANDKLSVILQWAPDLAKKVDEQVTKQESAK